LLNDNACRRCPRRIIDMAQQGTVDQKELANSAVRFLEATIDLSANALKALRKWLSRRG